MTFKACWRASHPLLNILALHGAILDLLGPIGAHLLPFGGAVVLDTFRANLLAVGRPGLGALGAGGPLGAHLLALHSSGALGAHLLPLDAGRALGALHARRALGTRCLGTLDPAFGRLGALAAALALDLLLVIAAAVAARARRGGGRDRQRGNAGGEE